MKKIFIACALLVGSYNIHAAQLPDDEGYITAHGEKRDIVGHINDVILWNKDSSFKHAKFYIKDGKTFKEVGTVENLGGLNSNYRDYLVKNNYTYYKEAGQMKLKCDYVSFDAILLGVKSLEDVKRLHVLLLLQNLPRNNKG